MGTAAQARAVASGRDREAALFGKTGASSRGELVARLFADRHWPRRATVQGR
ncbi:hypothetical protein AB0L25_27400 [Spirillospora sp. NPDC052242]